MTHPHRIRRTLAGIAVAALALTGCGEITSSGTPVTESQAGHHANGPVSYTHLTLPTILLV